MARKLFEFDNPGYLDTLNMEEECASEKTFVRTPVPSPRSQNKRSRSLNETDSAYQDLVNYKLMYQPLKKQHKNQAQRELPSVPSTPKTRRRSEPVVMITHSKGKFGCYESGHDSAILDSPSAKSKTKYLEPIDSTKSFRDRINSSLAEENSEVFADVESEQSTRKESVAKKDQCPHYYILEPPIKEESAETQAKSSSKRNSKETKKYKKTSKKLKRRGDDDDACGLRVENNNRRKTDKSSVETSTPDTADNPYYHVLEVVNQIEEPHNQPTRSFSHRLLERFSAKVRTDTRKTYDLSNTKPSPTNTRTNTSYCSLLNFLVGCILLFSVVTCVTTILVIRGQIQSLCICSQPKGSSQVAPSIAKPAAVYGNQFTILMEKLNNSVIEEKEKSRALAAEVRALTQMLQQIYNVTRGPPGPRGPQGPPGPQGQQGPQGTPGHPGVRGLRGLNGSEGGRGEQGPAGYNGSRGYPGVKGPPGVNGSQGERGPQGLKGAVVDFSNCSWKFKTGSNGVRHADVVLIEPKGKRIVGAICSTSSPSIPASYSFKLLDATAGSGNGYKCGCLTNGNLPLACVIHYCECPSVT